MFNKNYLVANKLGTTLYLFYLKIAESSALSSFPKLISVGCRGVTLLRWEQQLLILQTGFNLILRKICSTMRDSVPPPISSSLRFYN